MVASWIKKNSQLLTALLVAALFLAANSILLAKDFYYLWLLPVAGLAALLFFLRLETGLMAIALLTPFAVDFALVPGMELSMPVEPMMILFTLMFFFRVLVARNYDVRILRHPVIRIYGNDDLSLCRRDPGITHFCDTTIFIQYYTGTVLFRYTPCLIRTSVTHHDDLCIARKSLIRCFNRIHASLNVFLLIMSRNDNRYMRFQIPIFLHFSTTP